MSKEPTNILITEAYTDANIGSGALIENTIDLLRQRFPQARFRVMAVFPQAFDGFGGVESVPDPFEYPHKKSPIQKIKWIVKTLWRMGMAWMQARKGLRRFRFDAARFNDYLWADWVVSAHAERIKEAFYVDALYTLFSFRLAHLLGKKVILFPCTLGPYGFGTRALVNWWLRNVDILYTRDDLSTRLAHETAGLAPEKIIPCPDVAVIQKQIGREEALALIGCGPDDKLVGISVMRWRYINGEYMRLSNYSSYVAEMAKVADYLITKYGVKVVLYPTNYAIRGCTTEDREAVRDIYQAAVCKGQVVSFEQFVTPSQLKGALACSEVNITTRMHACIFSTGAGVPTISVNYLYKLKEYMASLGLEKFSIDIDFFNAEWMKTAFERMWDRRAEIREQIQTQMTAKQTLLHAQMDTLLRLG